VEGGGEREREREREREMPYFVIHFFDSFSTSLLHINQNNSKIPASVTYTSGHVSYTTNIITQTLSLVQQHNVITLNSSFRIAE
jgi:hypothetical protein